MTAAARFWAVDLHVHTPGSSDAKDEHYGTPGDIVEAALAAGLDAIAITDHNTVSWCLSLIHISEPTRQCCTSRIPSSA